MGCGGEGVHRHTQMCTHRTQNRGEGGAQMAKMDPTIYGAANIIVPKIYHVATIDIFGKFADCLEISSQKNIF